MLWKAKITRLHDLDGVSGVAEARVQLACGSPNLSDCEALSIAVYNHFDGFETPIPGIIGLETLSEDEMDDYEAPVDATDRGTYWIILTYTFRYQEAVPTG